MYYRYVDNTFSIFDNANDCDKFLHELNSLHPSLRFTFVKKVIDLFLFLMFRWKRSVLNLLHLFTVNSHLQTYLNWKSFGPEKDNSV